MPRVDDLINHVGKSTYISTLGSDTRLLAGLGGYERQVKDSLYYSNLDCTSST